MKISASLPAHHSCTDCSIYRFLAILRPVCAEAVTTADLHEDVLSALDGALAPQDAAQRLDRQ